MPETVIPRLPSVSQANAALARARAALAAHRLDVAQAELASDLTIGKTGRRPDLDATCSECARDGIARKDGSSRYGHGRTMAFRAPATNKRDREWPYRRYKAATIHHCPFHSEVEPLYLAPVTAVA